MKIMAYEVREDEKEFFEKISKDLNVDVTLNGEELTVDNVDLARGCQAVTIIKGIIGADVLDKLNEMDIKFLATRSIGFNHIDIEHANKLGIKVINSGYAPNGVADYAVMLILMSIRNCKAAMFRVNVNDYSLVGLQGKEMKDITIGVIGTGNIGRTVIQNLQGFGCRIIANSEFEDERVKEIATYVDLDTLYKESDVITLHAPLFDSTYHMINRESISKMKDGVVIVNTARGELTETIALIEGIESSKIGALGLDVIEKEEGIYHKDRRTDVITNRGMSYLKQFPNVIVTQHMAFYTDAAVRSMVDCALSGLVDLKTTGKSTYEVKVG